MTRGRGACGSSAVFKTFRSRESLLEHAVAVQGSLVPKRTDCVALLSPKELLEVGLSSD